MNPIPDTQPDSSSHARQRRARLIERFSEWKLDGALITDPVDIGYFTGTRPETPASVPACLLIRKSGESILVCGQSHAAHFVDRVVSYRWHEGGTIPGELLPRLIEHAVPALGTVGTRLGVQQESVRAQFLFALGLASGTPLDRIIFDIQRTKDPLDLFRIGRAIRANLAAFKSASCAITFGVNELEVYAAAVRGATLRAREKVIHDGDYRCGAPGGPCGDRTLAPDALYMIDAWTNVAGYWSDLARVFPVGTPSDRQAALIGHVQGIHERILPMLRPGTACGVLWSAMDSALRERPEIAASGLVHHGGHGIGVRLHESPDINPGVADALRVGDVVCIEPGAYTPIDNVRIEETYLITTTGAVCLSRPATN